MCLTGLEVSIVGLLTLPLPGASSSRRTSKMLTDASSGRSALVGEVPDEASVNIIEALREEEAPIAGKGQKSVGI